MLPEGAYAPVVLDLIARQVEAQALALYGEEYYACNAMMFINHHMLNVSGGRTGRPPESAVQGTTVATLLAQRQPCMLLLSLWEAW